MLTLPPVPVTLLDANRRNPSRPVRLVMDWLAETSADFLREPAALDAVDKPVSRT